jgi:hypothetical protein
MIIIMIPKDSSSQSECPGFAIVALPGNDQIIRAESGKKPGRQQQTGRTTRARPGRRGRDGLVTVMIQEKLIKEHQQTAR